jgi:hypothetical protein
MVESQLVRMMPKVHWNLASCLAKPASILASCCR